MKNAGTLDLARAAIAKRRAPGQIAPSKYLPDVPRQVHAAGGKVDDARADFLAGNHPEVPPVVYHSTKGDFHEFLPMSHFGTERAAHDRYKTGSWQPAHLEMDRNLANISVIPAHISLKNPIDLGRERDWQNNRDTLRQVADWMGGKLDKKYAYARQKLKDLVDDPRWGDYPHAMEQRGADIIRDTGHDGIIYTNTVEDPGSRSFITLGPEQVKSAISAREFDPENPDMTKAEGGAITKADGGTVEGAETVARMLREGRASEITNEHLDAADPQHLWKLYETGQTGMDMPMDAKSRAARAKELGFTSKEFHGTTTGGEMRYPSPNYGSGSREGIGFVTSSNPHVASSYADPKFGSVFPMLNRDKNLANIDAKGEVWSGIPKETEVELPGGAKTTVGRYASGPADMGGVHDTNQIARGARIEGDGGVRISNLIDHDIHVPDDRNDPSLRTEFQKKSSVPSDVTFRHDTRGIRSFFARFDPRLAHLSHLNASTGGKMEDPVDLNVERARKNVASGDLPKHIQNTFDSMAERNRAQLAAHQEAMQAGAFDDTRIGDEYRAPDGSTFKITNHFMMPANRWGGREPPSMVYQGHVPMVSTVYTDPKMKGFDMNRAVEHVKQMERIGGPLRVVKADGGDVEDLGVHRFHRRLNSDVQSTMNDMVDAHQKALQAGVFDGYEVGDRLQGQVGPLTVKARYMAKWRPGGASDKTIQRMGQIPTLMDHNGVTYHPMLRLTGADGSEGDYPLDAVRGYPKFTGLRVAKKNGGGVKLYSKAAQIIRGLPQAKGKAEDMVKAALGKGAKRAELEHADVAPGMASRDQVADYIEAVQPRIGVKKRGEGIGLTDQERDELGYLRSMMPHQRTPENDQRIAELNEKKFSSPQYEQYQLPGGENYREHVLTLDSHSHNDPYYARNHWGKMKNPLAHIRMSDRIAPSGMPPSQWMDAHDRMMKAIGVTDPSALAAGAPDAAVAKGAITPEEARAIAVDYGWTGSKYYKPKKILHVEELQSDWNNDARRKGFRTGTEQEDYYNFVKEMRQKAKDMIDATPMVKQALEKNYDTMDPHTLALKLGMQFEYRDAEYRAKNPGPPQAPYVNPKSDDWAELALKHVLHEAAQGGYDGITFTPDAEQSERWGGTDFNGMYDKKFPGIAARLVKQHDPSINPSTMQITQGVRGPMIPLTEQARRGILENGFSSFKKGGYVR